MTLVPDDSPGRRQFRRSFLKEWRLMAEVTQQELADECAVSKGHISHVERGTRQYTQELLEKAVTMLRRKIPSLTVATVIALDPRERGVTDLVDSAARVPESQRAAARAMLNALAEQADDRRIRGDPAPRTAPGRRRAR